uniref:3-isopropylmalate dehydratase small subunit n=1 Tax=Aquipseudomonas alcaligenes TaxID=43263 RepID=Q0QFQ6_AQUAC|nr:unknown [Pseudomonas alcaligenes]
MTPFTRLHALVVPIDRSNVDTDAIIPKQFMKSIKRTGFGDNLFDEWRYLDRGEPGQEVASRPKNPDFPLNQARYADAKILLTRENFGCGSSREHAPWALRDYGIRALIASSFADIFYGNCFKNGILPIRLDADTVEQLFQRLYDESGFSLEIDLATQRISSPGGFHTGFDIDPARKHRLLNGLDDIALTLQQARKIRSYEERHRLSEPWLFSQ